MKPNTSTTIVIVSLIKKFQVTVQSDLKKYGCDGKALSFLQVSVSNSSLCPLFFVKIFKHVRGALDHLVPFVQFKKRKNHPWMSVTFSKVADLPNRAKHRIYIFTALIM